MSFHKKHIIHRIIFIAMVITHLTTSGCLFDSKKKSRKTAGGQSPELIIKDSIFFDRLGDKTTARLTFKTKVPVQCELSHTPQDTTQDQKTEPRTPNRPCSSQQPSELEYSEKFSGLDPTKFYFIFITAKSLQNPNDIDSITIREPGSPATPNQPSTQAQKTPTPSSQTEGITELFIGRIDLVLKSGEVFRHIPKSPMNEEQIRNELKPELGCFDQAKTSIYPFRKQDPNPIISQLATRDLGSANAISRPELPGILNLEYANLNDGIDKWTFMYKSQNQDRIYTSRPVIQFSKVQVASSQIFDLDYPNLDETLEPMKIDSRRDLQIQWVVPPQTPASSYVHVQIGRPTLQKSVYCAFQADQRKGSIGTSFLSNLESGQHVISVGLATVIFSPKDKWITTAYDWRSGRIEK